jgi:anti-sigma B factor antagonist
MREIVMDPTEDKMFVEHREDETIVTIMTERLLDAQDIQELQNSLMTIVEQARRQKLVLDFCNVQFLSSAALGLLVKIQKNICERKGQLQLRNINPKIHEIFKITKLAKVFDIS